MKMNEIFHRKMKAFRKIYGASMEEFACELEISKTYIQNIEAGKANRLWKRCSRLAKSWAYRPFRC